MIKLGPDPEGHTRRGLYTMEILWYIHHRQYTYICHGQEQGRKTQGKEVQSDDCKVAQPKRVWLGHFVFGKYSTRSVMLTLVC